MTGTNACLPRNDRSHSRPLVGPRIDFVPYLAGNLDRLVLFRLRRLSGMVFATCAAMSRDEWACGKRIRTVGIGMCGRYELNETPANLGSHYRIDPGNLDFAPDADVRPTTTNPVVCIRHGARRIELRRWGLVPYWVEDPKAIGNPFNAMSETAPDKPFFRTAFRKRRCIVPANA